MVLFDSIVGALLNKVAPKVADHFTKRMELKYELKAKKIEGKIALEQRKIDMAQASEGRDHEWEMAQVNQHMSSLKDEWVLGLLSIPLIMCFIPGWDIYVTNGFAALDATPDYYRWMTISVFMAIYGIRVWRRESNHAKFFAKDK